MPSIAWVASWRDMPDATLPPHEIEKREEHIPSHDAEIEEKVGHAGEEAHFMFCVVSRIGITSRSSGGTDIQPRHYGCGQKEEDLSAIHGCFQHVL